MLAFGLMIRVFLYVRMELSRWMGHLTYYDQGVPYPLCSEMSICDGDGRKTLYSVVYSYLSFPVQDEW
jgi:hypothetical protein